MDWTRSGIQHAWEYQLVDATAMTERGWLMNVTGGKLTEAYRGDLRSQLSLDLDGETVPLGCAVRVWHTATYDGENVRELLGTFFPTPMGGKYEYGRMSGSVSLYSALVKLQGTRGKQVRSVGKFNIIAHFNEICGWALVTPYVQPGWNESKKFAAVYVWPMPSESILAEAQRCADAIGGYLGVDEHGRVTLKPYVLPSKLGQSWELLPGGITHLGVDIDVPDVVNRIVAKYENNGKTYGAVADLDASHPWSRQSIGRIVAEELTSVQVAEGANIQKTLDDAVKKELTSKTTATNTYSVDTDYSADIRCGTAGRLFYRDSNDDAGIDAKVFCSGREVNLDYTADMRLTLEAL